jgi:lysozyme family protein
MTFDIAYSKVLGHEGEYSNDTDDRGGETYKGISRKYWPVWNGWPIIDTLKSDVSFPKNIKNDMRVQAYVKDFYRIEFWNKLLCDDMPDEIKFELFDTAVNQGHKAAGEHLQNALNLLNVNGTKWPDLVVDGGIGQKTLAIARGCLYKKELANTMNILQGAYYIELCKRDKSQEKFFRGWLINRVTWIV